MALNVPGARTDMAGYFASRALYAEASSAPTPGATAGAAIAGVARVPVAWTPGVAGTIVANAPWTGLPQGAFVGSANLYGQLSGGALFETVDVQDATMPLPGGYNATLTVVVQ